jgi:sulfonate transport system ATP-binding protein
MNAISPQGSLRLYGFTRRFGDRTVIDNLDLSVPSGQFLALLGRSGSGKTTLLRTLSGLDELPQDAAAELPRPVSVVFQEPRLLPWRKVWRNVVLGLDGENASRQRAVEALAEVGLGPRADAWPLTLSGGEAQRVALARAFVREPRLLLLDEPFSALDALTRIRMHQLALDLWRRHTPTTIIVTHDVDEALTLADRVVVLAEGRLIADLLVDLPRPRSAAAPGFAELRRHLLGALGVDDHHDKAA